MAENKAYALSPRIPKGNLKYHYNTNAKTNPSSMISYNKQSTVDGVNPSSMQFGSKDTTAEADSRINDETERATVSTVNGPSATSPYMKDKCLSPRIRVKRPRQTYN